MNEVAIQRQEQDESTLKQAFAKLMLVGADPFEAALQIIPDNTARALRIANEWPADEEVKGWQAELRKEGFDPYEKEGLRETLITELLKIVKNDGSFNSADDRIKAAKTIGELKGLIERPQTNINNNVQNVSNRVMVIRESGSNEEWEAKLRLQQDALTNGATIQ